MKHRIAATMIVSLGLLAWSVAQNARQDLFDAKKSEVELEVMRGILDTTLGFVARELRGAQASSREDGLFKIMSWRSASINAFYLHGQGAVFVIPASSLRSMVGGASGMFKTADALRVDVERVEAEASALAEIAGKNLTGGVAGGVGGGVPGGVAGGVASGAAAAAQDAAKRAKEAELAKEEGKARAERAARSSENMRRKLAEAQERVKRRRAETEESRTRFLQQLGQIKGFLVEALANHGDSLTHVKPTEFLNVVITFDEGAEVLSGSGGGRPQREVLSVQKSSIADYKAGRLTLDAFKAKVLAYSY